MTSSLPEGVAGYIAVLIFALAAHESWRWLGAYIGNRLNETDAVFVWVRYVSAAIVTALAVRLTIFPAGELASLPLAARLAAVFVAVGSFMLFQRNLIVGIAAGAVTLVVLSVVL